MRGVAVPGAVGQIAIATALGVGVTAAVGWSLAGGLVFGIAISVASTVVLVRVLSDHDALHTPAGHIAVGWLLVEDLVTVLVLVLLPAIARARDVDALAIAATLALAVVKIAGLVAFTWVVGRRVIPALLRWIAGMRSRELFTLAVLAVALGIAVGSAQLFGASIALGAFLAGMVVGQSTFGARAMSDALPMRDAFAVLFFVAMGMLLDPRAVLEAPALGAATLGIVVVGKPLAAIALVLALRHPLRTALRVAVALAQIGEFSFIVAQLGLGLELLPPAAMHALVAASIVSIMINPLLFRAIERLGRSWGPRGGARPGAPPTRRAHHAVVVGYGPVGRTVVRILREHGITPTVVELNVETVEQLRREGIDAVYGDAAHASILERAGMASAESLLFTTSGSPAAVVSAAREVDARVPVIARATYVAESLALRTAGVETVIAAEAEVAIAMAEHLLARLGASPDQLDRARDELRRDLLGEQPPPRDGR